MSFLNLQVNGDAALQNGVIEDKANFEMVAVEGESLLTGQKSEATAKISPCSTGS